MLNAIKRVVKSVSTVHCPDGSPNVFLFSMPRSGSTWLMELIWSQPHFRYCDEPLDLRVPLVKQHLGITEWEDLYSHDASLPLQDYFQALCDGRLRFMNFNPIRRYYRPVTHRIVFKIIHGGEDRINWFRDTFNGRIVYLLRHPIAVTLSREVYPRLHAFLSSDYRRHFTRDQLEYAEKILDTGTKLDRGVLSWCLQNAVPLRESADDWTIVSYEQMVLDPSPVVMHLAERLGLSKPERMMHRLAIPSAVKSKSSKETQHVLEGRARRRSWLVEKWRKQVDEKDERRVMGILERFNIDVYTQGEVIPVDRLWIGPKRCQDICE